MLRSNSSLSRTFLQDSQTRMFRPDIECIKNFDSTLAKKQGDYFCVTSEFLEVSNNLWGTLVIRKILLSLKPTQFAKVSCSQSMEHRVTSCNRDLD